MDGAVARPGQDRRTWDISPWVLGPIFLAAQFATVRVHMKKTGATVPPLGIPMIFGLVERAPRP